MFKFLVQLNFVLIFSFIFASFSGQKILPYATQDVIRNYVYYAESAHMSLLKQSLEDTTPEKQEDFVKSLDGKIGHKILLMSIDTFSEKYQKKLASDENLVIFADDKDTEQFYEATKNKEQDIFFVAKVTADSDKVVVINHTGNSSESYHHLDGVEESILSVTYYLNLQLAKLPESQWNDYFQRVFTDIGPEVTLVAGSKVPEGLQETVLPNGTVIFKTAPNEFLDEKTSDIYYVKLTVKNQHNYHLKLSGMLEDRNFLYIKTFGIFGLLVLILMLLPIALWLMPSWISLRRIILATDTFSKGNLDTRAKPVFSSHLNVLTYQYNDMADNIQRLFDSHKMMTMAVSHDLRTPLSRLEFAMEMMRSSPENAHKQLDRMQTAVDDLSKLVSEVLLHATLDREDEAFEFERFDGKAWLDNEMEQWQFNHPNLSIQWQYSGNTMLEANSYYLSRALLNLMSNACKFAKTCVCVSIVSHDDNYTMIVEDDGTGIPTESINKIFQPFEKLDSSRNLQAGGTGLGLAIVKLVAERHNGTVTVQNKQDNAYEACETDETGALFTFTWNK